MSNGIQESMNPKNHKTLQEEKEEEEAGYRAIQLTTAITLPMLLRTSVDLGLIDAIHAAAGEFLSPMEIKNRLPTKPENPHAEVWLDRILRALASYSIVRCRTLRTEGTDVRMYGSAPICRFLARNGGDGDRDEDGGSLADFFMWIQDDVTINAWFRLKDMIVKGESAFELAHGMPLFEYSKKNERYNNLFNNAMANYTTVLMKKVLEVYKGFQGIKVLVDVGGGIGSNLNMITKKHPNIKAINFDLPAVIADAPPVPGVEHVGGDMFVEVPKGDAIFMKWILHDWGDEAMVKLLKNCWSAIPDNGKVIVVETIVPEEPETDVYSNKAFDMDVTVLTQYVGGKERSRKEFEALAVNSGFSGVRYVCRAYQFWVMEFYKSPENM